MVELDEAAFRRAVLEYGEPTVVEFHAPWCPFGMLLGPKLRRINAQWGRRWRVARVNVVTHEALAVALGIEYVPALALPRRRAPRGVVRRSADRRGARRDRGGVMNRKRRLDGRVAVVTGGARGIGPRRIALKLAAVGAQVVVNYVRNAHAAAATVSEIEAAGGSASALAADVGCPDATERLFANAVAAQGRLDIVVCNAGITRNAPIIGLGADAWSKVLRTNLDGVHHCYRAAASRMAATGGGVIVVIGSGSGLSPRPGQVNYSTSKAAILGLSPRWPANWRDRACVRWWSPPASPTPRWRGPFLKRPPRTRDG